MINNGFIGKSIKLNQGSERVACLKYLELLLFDFEN